MCFYDQHRFSCGDWEWAQFREQCSRESRPGKTCGLRLVGQTVTVDVKCDICEQIYARQLQYVLELSRIFHLQPDGPVMAASIARSDHTIKTLRSKIRTLGAERQSRSLSLHKVVNKTLETDDLGIRCKIH